MAEEKQSSWNAEDYSRHSSVQRNWARELLSQLNLRGHESVLDIGCGDGRITAEIAEKVPNGEVLGIDSSADMLVLAREKFSWSSHPNLSFQQRDAGALTCEAEFDLIFSSAALHRVQDHGPVLTGISRAVKLGGRILLQMAGQGNAASFLPILDKLIRTEEWRQYFIDFTFPYRFYGPECIDFSSRKQACILYGLNFFPRACLILIGADWRAGCVALGCRIQNGFRLSVEMPLLRIWLISILQSIPWTAGAQYISIWCALRLNPVRENLER